MSLFTLCLRPPWSASLFLLVFFSFSQTSKEPKKIKGAQIDDTKPDEKPCKDKRQIWRDNLQLFLKERGKKTIGGRTFSFALKLNTLKV